MTLPQKFGVLLFIVACGVLAVLVYLVRLTVFGV